MPERSSYPEICEIPGKAGLCLDKKRKFHYSRNMVKALNKRSMQEYADREKCTDADRSAGWKAFSDGRLQKVA